MHKIRLSALAEHDLLDIWHYSSAQWDEAQADKYLDELDRAIHLLANHPQMGADRDYLRTGYRAVFVNRHCIYYTSDRSTVRVVRVLHYRMDPERHL